MTMTYPSVSGVFVIERPVPASSPNVAGGTFPLSDFVSTYGAEELNPDVPE